MCGASTIVARRLEIRPKDFGIERFRIGAPAEIDFRKKAEAY
jgi:hypothetical protein